MDIVFDKFYKEYDQWYETKVGNFVDMVQTKTAFDLLEPEQNEKILDVGCGTGNFSYKLADKGCNVTGIDISTNMLAIAKGKLNTTTNPPIFYEMDSINLDFDDNTFDKIISMTAFEFIEDADKAIAELMRVLKPGGRLVIGTIQKGGSWYELYQGPDFDDSPYRSAIFRSREDFLNMDLDFLVSMDECLYTPPGLSIDEYTLASEDKYKNKIDKGGFLCVLMEKK